jgi:2-(1,2-epoxy-1,2-dihydrophenyl)acetyl-CoA isomerase
MDLLYFPRTVDAAESIDLGLATKVVADEELADVAGELAARLAAGPTMAYAAIREALAFAQTHDLADSLANEAELMGRTGRSADHAAAVRSFLAKEAPTFEGR